MAPHAAARCLRLGLRALKLVQPHERRARHDAGKPFSDEHGVHELAVLGDDIREASVVGVGRRAVVFEAHPAA
jgi:hypothetical protein